MLVGVTLSAATGLVRQDPPPGDPSSRVPIGELHRGEVIRFNVPGPAAVASKIKCGPGGDIYGIYSSVPSQEMWRAPIRRVSIASRSVTEYPIPAISGYQNLTRLSFDVSADGTLYALLRAYPQSDSKNKSDPLYLIVKYKNDGRVDSHFTMREVPFGKQINPTSLAMFADGSSLVSGTTLKKTPDANSLGVFSAVFDRNGAFRTPVTLMKVDAPAESSGSPDMRDTTQKTVQNAVEKHKHSANAVPLASSLHSASSSDGNVYVFQEDGRLDIVSPDGSLEREFELKPPAEGLSGFHMAAAGPGFLFVSYEHLTTEELGEDSRYRSMITVIYPQTGEVTAVYRMPQSETDFAVSACAASPKDFLFLSADTQGYLEVVHYLTN